MKVNADKTQLICISSNPHSDIRSYIRHDGKEMQSVNELKILGFWFSNKPTVELHIRKLEEKFRSRLWTLRKLKKNGMDNTDLLTVFKTVVRSIADFAAPTYHSLLSKTQTESLEKLQRRALKIIYGHSVPYSKCLELSGLDTLDNRREKLVKNFAEKQQRTTDSRTGGSRKNLALIILLGIHRRT